MEECGPGQGQHIEDLILNIDDWPNAGLEDVPSRLTFRKAQFEEYPFIGELVEKESIQKDLMGWYDQYKNLALDGRMDDIIVGLEQDTIIATAIIYTPESYSSIARDMPWPAAIGPSVGGIACICIAGMSFVVIFLLLSSSSLSHSRARARYIHSLTPARRPSSSNKQKGYYHDPAPWHVCGSAQGEGNNPDIPRRHSKWA